MANARRYFQVTVYVRKVQITSRDPIRDALPSAVVHLEHPCSSHHPSSQFRPGTFATFHDSDVRP